MLYRPVPRHVALASICLLGVLLMLARGAAATPVEGQSMVAAIIADARALLGAPYAYIGDTPNTGFSCIGFIHYLYARAGIEVPYNLTLAYAAGPHVRESKLRPGDLVFFSNTIWRGLSHVALYLGNDQIIGADSFATGVEETRLSDPYWVRHYTGATRPLAGVGGAEPPMPPSAPAPAPPRRRPLARAGEVLIRLSVAIVYSGPGVAYEVIDRLAPETALHVTQVQGAWANVWYRAAGGVLYGWVVAAP